MRPPTYCCSILPPTSVGVMRSGGTSDADEDSNAVEAGDVSAAGSGDGAERATEGDTTT